MTTTPRQLSFWRAAFIAAVALIVVGGLALLLLPRQANGQDTGRQLQRDLSRMLDELPEVAGSDVILRRDRHGDPIGATIRLRTTNRATLPPTLVDTATELAASALPHADADDIVLLTVDPPRTYRRTPDDAPDPQGLPFALKQRIEQQLAQRVERYFSRLNINAVASVSVALSMDKVREKVLRIDPDERGPFITRQERREQTDTVVPQLDAAAPEAGDIADFETAQPAAESERRTEFDYERVTREIVSAPGELADVRASVVLLDRLVQQEGTATWNADSVRDHLQQFQRHVANAIGAADIGAIEILHLPAAAPPPAPEAQPTAAERFATAMYGARYWLLAVVLVIGALAFGARLIRSESRSPERRPLQEPTRPVEPPPSPARDEQRLRELRDELAREIDRDAQGAADQLRAWLESAER